MAKRSFYLLVLVADLTAMIWIGQCQEYCGENKEYLKCGSACPKTCDDVANMTGSKVCTDNCVPGCFCNSSFVLSNGKCVPESSCTCLENAQYGCRKCDRTCEDVTRMGPPKVCTKICILGCECKEGYVLDSGKCIPQTQCRCQENSEYSENGTCQKTCEDVASMSSQPCTKSNGPGCYCKQGYALKATECIPQKECPCKEHAKYSDCSTACPLTCDNYKNPPKVCVASCMIGCACEDGYVKSRSGACVRPEQCSYT